ncbi:flagellum-specific ATP synthase FliI, partial [Sphingomonas sp. HMWF008]
MKALAAAARSLRELSPDQRFGRVIGVRGALIEVEGLTGAAQIGSHITVACAEGEVAAEVTGLDRNVAHCLPFSDPQGIASGARADLVAGRFSVRPSDAWLGRMVDGLGRPIDGKGTLPNG